MPRRAGRSCAKCCRDATRPDAYPTFGDIHATHPAPNPVPMQRLCQARHRALPTAPPPRRPPRTADPRPAPPTARFRRFPRLSAIIAPMSSRARFVLLLALCAGAVLVGVELMITAVALPKILGDLADWTQLRRASWIVNGYLLAYIAMMPLAGRLGDRFGIPRLYMAAARAVRHRAACSRGMAPTLDWLIGARIVQGLGAGAILPLATAGASHLYEGHTRARALGVVGAATFLGMALGPFLGATVLEVFDLGAGARPRPRLPGLHALDRGKLALGVLPWRAAGDHRRWSGSGPCRRAGPGRAGPAAAWTRWAPHSGRRRSRRASSRSPAWVRPRAPGALPIPLIAGAATLVLGAAAVRHALRTPEPFLDPRLFRNRVFSGAMLLSLLTGLRAGHRRSWAPPSSSTACATPAHRSSASCSARSPWRWRSGPWARGSCCGASASSPLSLVGLALSTSGLVILGLGDADDRPARAPCGPGPVRPGLRADRDAAQLAPRWRRSGGPRSASRARA